MARNNLRQMILAVHSQAATNQGRLPGTSSPTTYVAGEWSLFYAILPHLEVPEPWHWRTELGGVWVPVPLFRSTSDPSLSAGPVQQLSVLEHYAISYACNMQALLRSPTLAASFPDGTTNTIALAEHYWQTQQRDNRLLYAGLLVSENSAKHGWTGPRGPTFADQGWRDVYPVTSGSPPVSRPSEPVPPFQMMPKLANDVGQPLEADGRRLQAMRPSGLETALFDGSVRTFRPGVADTVFWAFVTPAAGDSTAE